MNIGTSELIVIVVLAIILYGKRLPEITRALGKGYQEFKKNVDDVKDNFQKQVEDSYSTSKADKYYTGASSKETAKENNKLIPVTQYENDSKNQDENLVG
ncbi:MAG: twin-arginine translocase TatA/TatE family subunit [Planctomycetota bacterium]